MDESVIVF